MLMSNELLIEDKGHFKSKGHLGADKLSYVFELPYSVIVPLALLFQC